MWKNTQRDSEQREMWFSIKQSYHLHMNDEQQCCWIITSVTERERLIMKMSRQFW